MSIYIGIPKNKITAKLFANDLSLIQEDLNKAQPYLESATRTMEVVINGLCSHLYSLIPNDSKYNEHRDFLNRKHKLEHGENRPSEDKLLNIFMYNETHPLQGNSYSGFNHGDKGEFSTSIKINNPGGGSNEPARIEAGKISKMISEINTFFKGIAEFTCYISVNETYATITFWLIREK